MRSRTPLRACRPRIRSRFELDIAAQSIAAEIIDDGRPFDPTEAADPDLSKYLEARDPGGLGILLMRRMVDRLSYRRGEGKNILRLETVRG